MSRAILAVGCVIAAAAARLLPHPPNATPVAAIALLGGATLPFPLSFLLPVAAMFLSDLVIGFDSLPVTLSVYGSFLLTSLLGRWLRGRPSPWCVLGASVGSSILFYLITNAAVWKFSHMYAPTADGLILSYLYALPFFRHTLLGDMAYTVALFTALHAVAPALARSVSRVMILLTPQRVLPHQKEV